MKKLLAVSSGGGHWIQMVCLKKAFTECDISFATVDTGYKKDVGECQLYKIIDANLSTKLKLALSALSVLIVVLRVRPHIIISTGAAPGFFALVFGKMIKARTIWVDSIANVETLSISGAKARRFADLYLTQWPELAEAEGPDYFGAVV